MNYRDVEIEAFGLEKTRGENREKFWTFKVRLSDSPSGSMSADEAVTVQFDHRPFRKKLAKLDSRALKGADLVAFGQELASYLIPEEKFNERSSVRSLLTDNRKAAEAEENGGMRLRLKLGYELAKLPWEFLYLPPPGGSGGVDGFLALDGRVSIVRHESLDSAKHKPAPTGKIKILAAFASAEGAAELDLDQEQKNLEDAIDGTKYLSADMLQDAEFSEMGEALLSKDIGIFHFAGHGDIQETMGASPGETIATATLGFDDAWIKAEQFAISLRDSGVRLAMIGACNSGRREGKNPWAGIATMLVKTGIPAVVANQFKILDKTAIAFSKLFYKALVAGMSIEEAVSAGRKAAYNADPDGRDWGIQVMYLRSPHSQILFKGARSKKRRTEYQEEVQQTIVQNITNIDSGGGTVITGNVTITGDFVGGNKNTGSTGDDRDSESPDSQPSRLDRSSDGPKNSEISKAMAQLKIDLIGKSTADNVQNVLDRLTDLENELQKEGQAEDSDIAAMVADLGRWVPQGTGAIKAAFADPALAKVGMGMFTQFALNEL
ncbi:MAG: CHAT domain-containing protein [Anaerolineae bacterium]